MMKYIAIGYMATLGLLMDAFFAVLHFAIWCLLWFPKNQKLYNTRYMIWRSDPLGGLLNHNWIFKFQAAINGFSGDCDKFATMAKWENKDAKVIRYTCLYPSIFKIHKAHVVSVVNDTILVDNGRIYSGGINKIKEKYPDRIIVKMLY